MWSEECGVILEEFDAFVVDFHSFEFALLLGEKLRENAHSRADFEDGNVGTGIDRVGDAAGDVQVAKKMLTEVFLGFHELHGCKIRQKKRCIRKKWHFFLYYSK